MIEGGTYYFSFNSPYYSCKTNFDADYPNGLYNYVTTYSDASGGTPRFDRRHNALVRRQDERPFWAITRRRCHTCRCWNCCGPLGLPTLGRAVPVPPTVAARPETYPRRNSGWATSAPRARFWAKRCWRWYLRKVVTQHAAGPSMDQVVLKGIIRKTIACRETLWLLDRLIDLNSTPKVYTRN